MGKPGHAWVGAWHGACYMMVVMWWGWEKCLYNGGIFSGYQTLLALHLSGTPSLKTGTRPPSCLHLDNHLYIYTYKWYHAPNGIDPSLQSHASYEASALPLGCQCLINTCFIKVVLKKFQQQFHISWSCWNFKMKCQKGLCQQAIWEVPNEY